VRLSCRRSCIHRIIHCTSARDGGRHGSKDVVLIMPSGWTASSSVGMRCSQSAKQSGPTEPTMAAEASVHVEHRLNLVRSRETDQENGYENRKWLRESIAGF